MEGASTGHSLPTVSEVCDTFHLTDVEVEYSDAKYRDLITYNKFQQHVRPFVSKANPKVRMGKIMMLVAAKWREFSEMNPYLKEDDEDVTCLSGQPNGSFEPRPKPKRRRHVSTPGRERHQAQKKRITETMEPRAPPRDQTHAAKAGGAGSLSFSAENRPEEDVGQVTTGRCSLEQTSSHAENREVHTITKPAAVIVPALAVSMWCLTCDAMPQALCFMEHTLRGMQAVVREAVQSLSAKQNAVAAELQRIEEGLQTWRALRGAAQTRQDLAALRAHTAAAERVQEAAAGLRQAVQDACRAELAGAAEQQAAQQPDKDAAGHSALAMSVPQDTTQPQLEDSLDLEDQKVIEIVVDSPAREAPEDIKVEGDDGDDDLPPSQGEASSSQHAHRLPPPEKDMEDFLVVPVPPFLPEVCFGDQTLGQRIDDGQERSDLLERPGLDKLPPFGPDECLDVLSLCQRKHLGRKRSDLLQKPGLEKVRRLDGVDCVKHPDWCRALLQRVAARVEWLYVFEADRAHLEVIRGMPALRHLWVHLNLPDGDAPELPLQLEELTLENVTASHFKSLQRMPFLRKLSLDWSDDPLDVASPPLPAHHRGLEWLWVALRPVSTALSLAKAHAATLRELRLLCASEGGTPWHFRHLADGLRQCGLAALRRVVLLRGPAPDFPDEKLPHSRKSCVQQKKAIGDTLLGEDAGRAGRRVVVLCADCDDAPDFPELGDLTWRDA